MLAISSYDLTFVTESWLNKNVQDALITSQGYSIIRRDRLNKSGGGVCVIHKRGIQVVEQRTFNPVNFEYLCNMHRHN